NLLVRGASDESFAAYRSEVENLRRLVESQERELARRSSAFRESRRREEIDLSRVMASLPEGSGLVAYAVCGGRQKRYVAFAVSRDRKVVGIPVGDRARVDDLVRAWRKEVATPPERAGGTRRGRPSTPGEDLRRAVWDPVAARLGDVSRVYVVLDGSLLLVNFDALPMDGRYLVETELDLRYLATERDLAVRSIDAPRGTGLLALGGVAFGSTARSGASASRKLRGTDADCPDLATITFEPLPETRREVEAIVGSWPDSEPCSLLLGADATEAAFKAQAAGKRVIHVATHGFFLGEECGAEVAGGRGIGATVRPGAKVVPRRKHVAERNPLLLSGLALAGANRRAGVRAGEEDGILTCDEVAALDLSHAEWAVLSACDTGLGRIQAGEGVLGLRRAFRVAGARCLVMSLWAVEDRATMEWMKAFYDAVGSTGTPAEEAVRMASRGVLGHRRAQRESTHPFYWASFVAVGDGR
ncbi:MAG TPA: CHAT domain-containing protein, partial [Candidatus Eisenbacteria bacterium]|nr:CHAT domain-containing protein [Candidatus Eisenbacteria bacterium]